MSVQGTATDGDHAGARAGSAERAGAGRRAEGPDPQVRRGPEGHAVDGQEPIMIFGRVTRGDGGPLTGAALTLCDLAGDQLDRASADDGGHYQLVPPAGGTYLVICSSTTHQPRASLVAVADRPLRHDLTLSGGGSTLGGTVGVRRGGPGATNGSAALTGSSGVVLTLTDVRGTVVSVARSAADGGFAFADLAEGVYTLTAAAENLAPVAETVQMPAEGHVTHDMVLAAQTHLTGTVRAAGANRPIPDALTTLVGGDGNVVGSAVTGEHGTFRFDDVAEGVYTITASGYAPVASEIEVGPGRPSEVLLTLVPPVVDGGAPSTNGARHSADADPRGDAEDAPTLDQSGDTR